MANIPRPSVLIQGRTADDVNTPVLVDDQGIVQVSSGGGGGGAVTIADGADVAEGAKADAAVADATGTVNAHARFIAKVAADEWDSVNHWQKVREQGTVAVINGLSIVAYDYVSLTQASTTDTYVFKSGGSGGTTVATVVITYTDSTKATLATVAKS